MKVAIILACVFALAQSLDLSVAPHLDGGDVAIEGQYPWHVHIQPLLINANFSGVLISPAWVLTCAACINKDENHDLLFGALNLDIENEPNRVVRTVTKEDVVFYPSYNSSQFNVNNIALVRLAEPLASGYYIDLIRLTDGSSTYDDVIGRVTGFGFASKNETTGTQLLRSADLKILPDTSCRNLQEGQMCAEILPDGIGPCRDEGSGLYITDSDGKGTLVGIFSYGYAEGQCPGTKALFTRVSPFLTWIDETINGVAETTAVPEPTLAFDDDDDGDDDDYEY